MSNQLVRITDKDTVAVALSPLAAGVPAAYPGGSVTPLADIPMGHKVALRDIARGEAVIKFSSNTPLAARKKSWIDFDAGRLLSGQTLDQLGRELMDLVLSVASGRLTRNEENGFHDLAIFKQGVTL